MLPSIPELNLPGLLFQVMSLSSLMKEFYNLKAVITHGVLLDQAFAHCPIFPIVAFSVFSRQY